MAECDLPRPDPQTLYQQITDLFSANVLGGAPVIPESNEWFVVNNDYAAAETFHSIAVAMFKEQDVATACCDNLVKLAADMGMYPAPASFAEGYVQITGVPGTAIPTNLEFQFAGKTYRINPLATTPDTINASGVAIIQVKATEPGTESNNPLSGGLTSGTITTPVPNIDSAVNVLGQFCNGAEAEDCEAFRLRVIERRKYGGKADYNWLVQKFKQWPCVTRVCRRLCGCCFENRFEVYVFFDNTFPNGIPPANVAADLTRWMFGNPNGAGMGQAPMGVFGQVYVAATEAVNIDIINLDCVTEAQVKEIRRQFAELFRNLCPGEKVCRRWLDAIIMNVEPRACNYTMSINFQGTTLALNCFGTLGDINPPCDVLPILGELNIS